MNVPLRLFLLCVMAAIGTCRIAMGQAAQSDRSRREIVSLTKHLTWASVGGNCESLGASCPEGEAATMLVRIGKPATEELLKVLNDKNRGVAAHVVLTAIWEPGATSTTRFGRMGIISTSNGLEWEQRFTKNGFWYRVGSSALSRNAARWKQKISGSPSSTTDREKAGLVGPVANIKVESTYFKFQNNKFVESERELREESEYDKMGKLVTQKKFPMLGDPAFCHYEYKYDDKHRETQRFCMEGTRERILEKYAYEDDRFGNWIKRQASVFDTDGFRAQWTLYRTIIYFD